MRKSLTGLFLSFFLLTAVGTAGAQDIITASDLFKLVSANYESFKDYTAKVSIVQNKETMTGLLVYKAPLSFRIDFSDPPKQVMVSDGLQLQVYLPRYSVTFTQELKKPDSAGAAGLATAQGLKLLRNYSISYLNGPDKEALEAGSAEMVYKLKLTSASELYRTLEVSISERDGAYYIRRFLGTTVGFATVQMDFQDLKVNQDIPDSRFKFDNPPNANIVRNFLFEPEG